MHRFVYICFTSKTKCSIEATVGENVGEIVEENVREKVGEHVGENQNDKKHVLLLFFRDFVFGDHRCVVESIFTPFGPGLCGFNYLIIPAVGCLYFFEASTIRAHVPGAPRGSLGSRGVRRNPANYPRAPKAPSGTLGIYLVHVFDPGAPQSPRGTLAFGGWRISWPASGGNIGVIALENFERLTTRRRHSYKFWF